MHNGGPSLAKGVKLHSTSNLVILSIQLQIKYYHVQDSTIIFIQFYPKLPLWSKRKFRGKYALKKFSPLYSCVFFTQNGYMHRNPRTLIKRVKRENYFDCSQRVFLNLLKRYVWQDVVSRKTNLHGFLRKRPNLKPSHNHANHTLNIRYQDWSISNSVCVGQPIRSTVC